MATYTDPKGNTTTYNRARMYAYYKTTKEIIDPMLYVDITFNHSDSTLSPFFYNKEDAEEWGREWEEKQGKAYTDLKGYLILNNDLCFWYCKVDKKIKNQTYNNIRSNDLGERYTDGPVFKNESDAIAWGKEYEERQNKSNCDCFYETPKTKWLPDTSLTARDIQIVAVDRAKVER